MKKLLGLGAAALAVPAAVASMALIHPIAAVAAPAANSSVNVVGEPYAKAIQILKTQGVKGFFGGSFGSDLPQSACIVSQQKMTTAGRMYLDLDCTQKAADNATDSTPATAAAPNAPSPGNGQGTYGGPIGVPVPVG